MSDASWSRRGVDGRDKPGHDDGAAKADPQTGYKQLTL
jgi:hypothetical protein